MISHTTGANNTALGACALQANATSNNTAVGFCALRCNTTGTNNVSIGAFALRWNTTGVRNTAVGVQASRNITTATGTTSVGNDALRNNTTGNVNSAFGDVALANNTTGGYNTALGRASLYANTTGATNVAIGYRALFSNTASANVATGFCALVGNTSGQQNTAFGHRSLQANTTGRLNTGLGYAAGCSITTGCRNVVIGSATAASFATQNNNIIISDGDGNIRMFATGSTGYVGVGTTAPQASLHVSGTADVLLVEGSGSTANTTIMAIDGNNGRLFEVSDDLSDSLFSVNTIAGLPVMEAFADNTVTLGAYGAYSLHITGSKVGIGTSTPTHLLHVNGDARIDSTGTTPTVQGGTPVDCIGNGDPGFYMGQPNVWLKLTIEGAEYVIPAYEQA